jgi:hypothetical protein
MQHFWLSTACLFWNRLVKGRSKPSGVAYYDVFRYDLQLAQEPGFRFSDLWVAKMLLVLGALGYEWKADTPQSEQLVDVRQVMKAFEQRLSEAWKPFEGGERVEPRGYERGGLSLCVYQGWMGAPTGAEHCPVRYQRLQLPLGHVHALMRFRTCAWPLEMYRSHGRARAARCCRVCQSGQVEDEKHVVFECCAYDELRSACGLSFEDDADGGDMMISFMSRSDPRKLGAFLFSVYERRNALLRA